MTTDRELMQQALDALEGAIDAHQNEINDHITKYGEWYRPQRLEFMKEELANTEQTIEALRARLTQPEFIWTELSDEDAAELKAAITAEGRKSNQQIKGEEQMSGFGDAPIKGEGQWVKYDNSQPDPTPEEIEFLKSQPQTTWIEFSIPEEWEEECWDMINAWRKKKYEESDDASDK